jgi:hypothetical protein
MRVEVTSLLLSHEGNGVGKRCGGGGTATIVAGGKLSLRCLLGCRTVWAKTLGERRAMIDDDNDGRRGGHVFVGVGATPIPAVKDPPLPDGEGE